MWQDLHFSGSASIAMQLILVERILPEQSHSKSQPLWLVWVGQEMPPLAKIWRQYLRRFAVDHWYRFIKQRLHWTVPQLSTPCQCERWSDLMPILTWELWLARDLVAQHHLPWQKPLSFFDSRAGGSVNRITFTPDWYTDCLSQTPWKVSRLASGKQTYYKNSLPGSQKRENTAQKTD